MDKEHLSDSLVSREDFRQTRPMPTFSVSEMTPFGYQELVRDTSRNRRSLELIVQSYLDFYSYEDRISLFLGPSPSQPEAPDDALWFDRTLIESLLTSTQSLLAGDYSLENLSAAKNLTTAYYALCQSNVTNHLEMIDDMDVRAREVRSVVEELAIEKTEVETLEEIAEKIRRIELYLRVGETSRDLLGREIENMKRALKAFHYLTSLS